MAKRALLCGCNYPGSQHALNGCVNDVRAMQKMLTQHLGFADTDVTILIDTDSNYEQPTGANVKVYLVPVLQRGAGNVLHSQPLTAGFDQCPVSGPRSSPGTY
eukprot:GHUV01056415.1.p2 GENE.GHUV01056415.1~~GHUV01056415.1.p2  ORF type:complete len:103 (-),score=9.38 GHUV01056415.1:11-319(-)